MRIVIVGPGAMGCLFAAFLSKSKEEIWLLDKRPERARLIKQEGVRIEGVSGKWRAKINATSDAKEIKDASLVVICVKSYDTKQAIRQARPLISEETSVLTLQNGVGNIELIGEVVGYEKVIGGTTNEGATLLSPGCIRHAGRGETVIGRMDGRLNSALRQTREIFNQAGLKTRLCRDIKGLLWSKLIINVGINAITAITRLNNGRLTELEGLNRILRQAVAEAIKVAKRKRIKLIYDDPLAKVEAVCEATSSNVSSMLQDVLKRKRTEIDFINGVIVRQAQSLGILTPVNSCLLDLVKSIEASYDFRVRS